MEKRNHQKEEKIYYQDYENLVFQEKMKIRLEIETLSYDAVGIAKVKGTLKDGTVIENYPIFVPKTLPKEKAVVEITELKKTYGTARLLDIRYHNYDIRVNPICPNFESCGGCDLMHMNYDYQLVFKQQAVKETLEHLGGIKDIEIETIEKMDDPYHYRNKVQVPFRYHNGKTICGFYKKFTHEIVSLQDCYIQSNLANDIVKFVRNIANELKIKGYDEDKNEGVIRHLLVRETKNHDNYMLVIVTKDRKIPSLDLFLKKIKMRYPMITSIIQNINPNPGNVILGKENHVLDGSPVIVDELLNTKFQIGPMSFYQVNPIQTEKLYQGVIEFANLSKEDVLIDAYCGIGTIGLIAAPYVKKVYGVEIVEEAIKNAIINKKLNNINNVEFVVGKAENQIKKWANAINPTVLVVDPPRKGCDETFLETVVKMKIPKIVYVSCNPATLARDLKYLVTNNYEVLRIKPYDMFPNSNHVETIALLSLK